MLSITPNVEVQADSVHACTSRVARLVWLFSYSHCVTVQRHLQRVVISTRWLWLWQRVRVVLFERISRIIYRAQTLPSLAFWRYLSLADSGASESAFFLISIALKRESNSSDWTEVPLLTVSEELPRERDWARVVTVNTNNLPAYLAELDKGRAMLKRLGVSVQLRVWRAQYAGPEAGTLIVTQEYPSWAAFADGQAKTMADPEFVKWLAGLDKV